MGRVGSKAPAAGCPGSASEAPSKQARDEYNLCEGASPKWQGAQDHSSWDLCDGDPRLCRTDCSTIALDAWWREGERRERETALERLARFVYQRRMTRNVYFWTCSREHWQCRGRYPVTRSALCPGSGQSVESLQDCRSDL